MGHQENFRLAERMETLMQVTWEWQILGIMSVWVQVTETESNWLNNETCIYLP